MKEQSLLKLINDEQSEKQALLKVLDLNNRPRFDIGLDEIDKIAERLASNNSDRIGFVTDPTTFLKEQMIPVSSCDLNVKEVPKTTEACTVVAVCLAVAWTAVAAVQNVGAAFNAGALFNVAVYFTIYSYTQVKSGGGCFLPGTLVNIPNDSTKPIEYVCVGDKVLSFDEKSKKLEYNTVTRVYRTEQPRYYVINNQIRATARHPFRVNDRWTQVKDIRVGDVLLDKDNDPVKVQSIQMMDNPTRVFNFTVDKAHTYFVHDILVHNKEEGAEGASGRAGMAWNLGAPGTVV